MQSQGDGSKFRLGAMFLDNLVLFILLLLLGRAFASTGPTILALAIIGVALAYFYIQEGLWATTLGKRVFGLRVVRADGSLARWRESAIRTVLRLIEVNPILFGALPGGVAVIMTRNNQRLGDLLAGTVVVRYGQGQTATDEDHEVADQFS